MKKYTLFCLSLILTASLFAQEMNEKQKKKETKAKQQKEMAATIKAHLLAKQFVFELIEVTRYYNPYSSDIEDRILLDPLSFYLIVQNNKGMYRFPAWCQVER